MARGRTGERGAALLLVMVAVAVLTALAVDLAYDSRVTLRIAANGRDDLRASWAARGGVNLARLVLSLQQQIDSQAQGGGAAAAARPMLWRLVTVDSALARGLFEEREGSGSPPDFRANIDDEASKVNAQLEGSVSGLLGAQVEALYRLVCDPRWDALFDREDEKGNRVSRRDLLVYLRDWVDDDSDSSALTAQFPAGTCDLVMTRPDPFEPAGGDENQPYDRGPDRYRTRNARMDSIDELYQVAGIGDAFMAAFGDSLTVYLKRDAKRTVNELGKDALVAIASAMAYPKGQAMLRDPAFADCLLKAVAESTIGGMLSMSPQALGQLAGACGLGVNGVLLGDAAHTPFTDRSDTYRIRAEASAGAVDKALDVVVRFDGTTESGAPAAAGQIALGRPIHWREE